MDPSEIPGLDSLLGGYDVFGMFADAKSSKEALFAKTEMKEFTFEGETPGKEYTYLKPAWVQHAKSSSAYPWAAAETTEHAYQLSISTRTSVEGKSAAFVGEVNASFSEHERLAPSRAYSAYEELRINWTLSMPDESALALRARLTPEALKAIDGALSPTKLFEQYGTHHVRTIWMGGKAARYSSTDTTKYSSTISIEVAAPDGLQEGGEGAHQGRGGQVRHGHRVVRGASLTLPRSRGGSAASASQIFDLGLDAWSATVEDSPALADFPRTDALVPIWELAESPERRAELAAAFDAQVTSMTCILYGDDIYLKLGTKTVRYLCGGRGDPQENVYVKAKIDDDKRFHWLVHQDTATVGSGPVEYGHVVSLRTTANLNRWLTGVRKGNHDRVYTMDPASDPTTTLPTYHWRLQKSFDVVGSGPIPYEDLENGKIYLCCEFVYKEVPRWLTGGRGEPNEHVYTKDPEDDTELDTYVWFANRKID